jgi:hypothetical protein
MGVEQHERNGSPNVSLVEREAVAMARSLRSEDEGKRIVNPDGAVIGSVAVVRDGNAYVRPKSGLLKGWSSWISGPQCEGSLFPLDYGAVVGVEEETVVVDR